ncbi:MAG: hypothetical protein IKE61_01580 [Coriobacteriales bacterium]|nr:hypothetical protein [Coriobacteriales bacterium]
MDKIDTIGNTTTAADANISEHYAMWEHPQAIELYSGDRSQWRYDIYAKELLDDVFGHDEVSPAELAWAAWIICGMRADAIVECNGLQQKLAGELQTLLFFGPELQRRWLKRNRFEQPALPAWMLPGDRSRAKGDGPRGQALRNAVAEDDFCRAWLALHGAQATSTRVADREVRDWLTESYFYF